MKKIISLMLTISLVFLVACGKKDSSSDAKSTVDMKELCKTMVAADASIPEMLNVYDSDNDADALFAYISENFEYNKVEHYFLSYSAEGKADEIVVIAVKDTADIDGAVEALEQHKKHRISMFEQYDPDNVTKVQNGIVFKSSQYAVLIICDDTDAVKTAFEQFTK